MKCSWRLQSTLAFKVVCTGISLIIPFMISASLCAAEGKWITCKEGVSLWNSQPVSNESCSWTGGVNDEKKAHGTGVVVWFQDGAIIQVTMMERDNGQIKSIFKIIERDGTITQPSASPEPKPQCPYDIQAAENSLRTAYRKVCVDLGTYPMRAMQQSGPLMDQAVAKAEKILAYPECEDSDEAIRLRTLVNNAHNDIMEIRSQLLKGEYARCQYFPK